MSPSGRSSSSSGTTHNTNRPPFWSRNLRLNSSPSSTDPRGVSTQKRLRLFQSASWSSESNDSRSVRATFSGVFASKRGSQSAVPSKNHDKFRVEGSPPRQTTTIRSWYSPPTTRTTQRSASRWLISSTSATGAYPPAIGRTQMISSAPGSKALICIVSSAGAPTARAKGIFRSPASRSKSFFACWIDDASRVSHATVVSPDESRILMTPTVVLLVDPRRVDRTRVRLWKSRGSSWGFRKGGPTWADGLQPLTPAWFPIALEQTNRLRRFTRSRSVPFFL
jgi:hypothetical protein